MSLGVCVDVNDGGDGGESELNHLFVSRRPACIKRI